MINKMASQDFHELFSELSRLVYNRGLQPIPLDRRGDICKLVEIVNALWKNVGGRCNVCNIKCFPVEGKCEYCSIEINRVSRILDDQIRELESMRSQLPQT